MQGPSCCSPLCIWHRHHNGQRLHPPQEVLQAVQCCSVRSTKAAAEGQIYIHSVEPVEWCEHTAEGCKVCENIIKRQKGGRPTNNRKGGVGQQALLTEAQRISLTSFFPEMQKKKAFTSGANNPWDQLSWCRVSHLWGTIRSTSTVTLWFSDLCGLCSLHSEVANSDMNMLVFTCTLANKRFGTCQGESCPHCHGSQPLKILPPTDMLMKILGRVLVTCPTCQVKVSLCNLNTHTATKCEEVRTVQDIPISDILSKSWTTPPTTAEQHVAANIVRWMMSMPGETICLPTAGQATLYIHSHIHLLMCQQLEYPLHKLVGRQYVSVAMIWRIFEPACPRIQKHSFMLRWRGCRLMRGSSCLWVQGSL